APAGLKEAVVEVQLPYQPRAISVAVATETGARSSGAFSPEGAPVDLAPATVPLSGQTRNGIRIDGNFGDWAGVPRAAEPLSEELAGRLDITSAAAIGDGEGAQFYLNARSQVLEGTLPLRASAIAPAQVASTPSTPLPPRRTAGTDLLEVYLDTDSDPATGASAFGLGAEQLLRVDGVAGRVVSTQAFTFTPAQGWVLSPANVEAAAAGGELELSVVAAGLLGGDARFVLQGFEGGRDVTTSAITVGQMAGAGVPVGGLSAEPDAPEGPEPAVNPIPEISNVMAISAGVLSIVLVRRRMGARAGSKRGA
ncbi:MAG: hypothetical protein ACRDKW_15530, partial [Actinomycetota bacterium]